MELSNNVYMHSVTASIESDEFWMANIEPEEIQLRNLDSKIQVWNQYVDEGIFIKIGPKDLVNLEQCRDYLKAADKQTDLTSLPNWDRGIKDTTNVLSWDKDNYLDCQGNIKPRCNICRETHCDCGDGLMLINEDQAELIQHHFAEVVEHEEKDFKESLYESEEFPECHPYAIALRILEEVFNYDFIQPLSYWKSEFESGKFE